MFPNTLPSDAQTALAVLGSIPLFSNYYMAGGTALALQLGHRKSVDFDFFSELQPQYKLVLDALSQKGTFVSDQQTPDTLLGYFNGIKFSLFTYQYPLIHKTIDFSGIRLAHVSDIAAMKLVAISGRGTKKDYIDLYFLSHIYSWDTLFSFYDQKYHIFEQNKVTILKSLSFYEDADDTEMPYMFKPVEWSAVKNYFEKETVRLWKKISRE